MSNYFPTRDTLAKRIAGEIVLSGNSGQTMRKWRNLLSISQIEMANYLNLSPSVISDYETGRRRSPGSGFIKRYVESLLEIDGHRGGQYIRQLSRITLDPSDVFSDIREFMAPVSIALLLSGCSLSGKVREAHSRWLLVLLIGLTHEGSQCNQRDKQD